MERENKERYFPKSLVWENEISRKVKKIVSKRTTEKELKWEEKKEREKKEKGRGRRER